MPLEIAGGWSIKWNHFYDVCAIEQYKLKGVLLYPFHEDMLLIESKDYRLSCDLGWYPEGNPEGKYRLNVLPWSKPKQLHPTPKQSLSRNFQGSDLIYELQDKSEVLWRSPILEFVTQDRFEIATKLNETLSAQYS